MRKRAVLFLCSFLLILVKAGQFIEDKIINDGSLSVANNGIFQDVYEHALGNNGYLQPSSILDTLIQPYSNTFDTSPQRITDQCYNSNCYYPCQNSNCFQTNNCISQTCEPCGKSNEPRELSQTVQVPVKVPRNVATRTKKRVPARTEIENVAPESDTETICPTNYQMDSNECVSSIRPICPTSFEWRNNVCVKTLTICPIDHNSQGDSCVAKIICPTNYILRGNTCIAPTPICKIGWRWNGDICIIERSVCQAGYTLNHEGKCEDEFLSCPPGYKRVPNTKYCTENQPVCPSGYVMTSYNQCTRTIQKCPANSYQQYGRCVTSKFVCPAGSQQEGNECISEEIVNYTKFDIIMRPMEVKQPSCVNKCQSCAPNNQCC